MILFAAGGSVAIRFTYTELAPFWSGAARFMCSSIFFWAVVLIRKLELPRGRALMGAILFGVFSMGLPFVFIYWGLVKTPASLYQMFSALIPLLTLFLAFFHRLEPFRSRGLLGAGLSVIGIGVALGGAVGGELAVPYVLAIIAGVACLAEAGIIAKSFPPLDLYVTNAIATLSGGLIMLAASFLSGEKMAIPGQPTATIAFTYTVIFATIIAYLLYLYVLAHWTASGLSYSFVIIPLVTAVIANTLAKEQITIQFGIGGALIVMGVWIGALLPSKQKQPQAE